MYSYNIIAKQYFINYMSSYNIIIYNVIMNNNNNHQIHGMHYNNNGRVCLDVEDEKLLSKNERLDLMKDKKTSIQISPETRDRLYRLKFRKTYEQFLSELCDMYEERELEGDIKR